MKKNPKLAGMTTRKSQEKTARRVQKFVAATLPPGQQCMVIFRHFCPATGGESLVIVSNSPGSNAIILKALMEHAGELSPLPGDEPSAETVN